MTTPDPVGCTLFLAAAFVLAGVVQAAWLCSAVSRHFAVPLDGGITLRGQRLFGPNKTWRGLVVMVPAVGLSFASLRLLAEWPSDLWPLSPGSYFQLGCWVGLGFMLGELPNSFVKRRLDIAPGEQPHRPIARAVGFFVDQADSLVGGLVALSLVVPVSPWVWVAVIVLGTGIHWLFNLALLWLGLKRRAG